MKNILEAVSVGLVLLLSLGLIGLVVRYNTLDTTETAPMDPQIMQSLQNNEVPVTKEKKVSNYLQTLESYKDVDVKVDPKSQPSNVNVATVETEIKKDGAVGNIGKVVQTTEKNENYVSNLQNYDPSKASDDSVVKSAEAEENATLSVEEQMEKDPMSAIVNDIDAIVDTAEEK